MSGSSDIRTSIDKEYLRHFGDVIVGRYDEQGNLIKASVTVDDPDEIARKQEMYANVRGAELLKPKKTKKGKPIKVAKRKRTVTDDDDIEPLTPAVTARELEEEEPPHMPPKQLVKPTVLVKRKAVYLHNQMGKIKMHIESLLESAMAYCLVFADEDDVIFTPNAGETLNFTDPNGDTTSVYYADTLFDWTDGKKKLMILFKSND